MHGQTSITCCKGIPALLQAKEHHATPAHPGSHLDCVFSFATVALLDAVALGVEVLLGLQRSFCSNSICFCIGSSHICKFNLLAFIGLLERFCLDVEDCRSCGQFRQDSHLSAAFACQGDLNLQNGDFESAALLAFSFFFPLFPW